MINALMAFLAKQKLDHHSKAIADVLPKIVALDIPEIVPYFDSRIIETPETAIFTHGDLNPKTKGLMSSAFTVNSDEASTQLFKEKKDYESVN